MMARIRYFTTYQGQHIQTGAPGPWTDYEKVKRWHLANNEPCVDFGFIGNVPKVATVSHYLELEACPA